ncbi:MAG: ECF-type sigma factor [Rudaea sp.]|uniref:ECF-type sigma factor n=1 Tax=Rudaea sp. TaxID=2136325 RepID=UPI0039E3C31C
MPPRRARSSTSSRSTRRCQNLAEFDPRAGRIVELRIFSGLDIAEIARLHDLTERTVFRDWRRARAFLVQQLGLAGAAG